MDWRMKLQASAHRKLSGEEGLGRGLCPPDVLVSTAGLVMAMMVGR